MSELDIRCAEAEEITTIKYREKNDLIIANDTGVAVGLGTGLVCTYSELDDFIAACRKAKELWHK